MKQIKYMFILFAVLYFGNAADVRAQNVAENSASIKSSNKLSSFDYRVQNLKSFFERYNSPLSKYADKFVAYADKNSIDYRLIPAITGVESTFGKNIPTNSYNAYGWANGEYSFNSWEDSISHVSSVLKQKYIGKGANTISEIARIYAPPSTTWGGNVSYFVNKIDTLPLDFDII